MSALLFAAAWKGTLLAALVLLLHRVARNHVPPRWWCWLLLVAIARLLLPIAPESPFSVFNLVRSSATPSPVVIVDAAGHPAPALPLAPPVAPVRTPPWRTLVLALWLGVAALILLRTFIQSVRFQRRLRDGRDVDLSPLVDECREALRVCRHVRVMVTDAVATPSLHGWVRPALLLPQGFVQSFPRDRQRYVVLHELAHLRRADVLVNWIATAARALHWFNPVVRLAVARLAEERELACDALALDALRAEERPAYGGTVLELVDRLRGADRLPALVGMTASPQQLKRRIVMIASFRSPSRYSMVFAALIAAVALATLTDARAQVVRTEKRHPADLSPAAHATMERLDQNMNVDLTSASLEDVLHAVSNATGVSFSIAPNSVAGSPRVTLKGTNVPAQLVLMETLSSLELSVRFVDSGVEVVQAPGRMFEPPMERKADAAAMKRTAEMDAQRHPGGPGEAAEKRAAELAAMSTKRDVVYLRSANPEAKARRIDLDEQSPTHRKLTIVPADGSAGGTLEIDVQQ